jgi:hypothetical protein
MLKAFPRFVSANLLPIVFL